MARNPFKRTFLEVADENDEDTVRKYKFQILLPDGTSTKVTLHNPGNDMPIDDFVREIKKEVDKSGKTSNNLKRKISWNNDIYFEDMHDFEVRRKICFKHFKTDGCHILKLHDGDAESVDTFHNMWDLTPSTDILQELPAEYTFETALADLIDNSLQAVWTNAPGERKLIKITVDRQKIVIFDSGPGMDSSKEKSISKWGKMGASTHRSYRRTAVGGKAPYLMPFFGMFGYGGPIASMHLGRYAIVSSKTIESKKVYMLKFSREKLMTKSSGKGIWRADGGIRNPSEEEVVLSPHGSFTKVEIQDLKMGCMETRKLQCYLKDIYFPYIQCDEMLSRKTTTPIEFQVNDSDLTEVDGGEVATTNLHSCNGPEFVLHLKLTITEQTSSSSESTSHRQANARMKFIYFPIVEGKENIDRILEKLESDGFSKRVFSHISVRRLGRLLPDIRWGSLPFMEINQNRGAKAQLLKRCFHRVKCFIDADAGFCPTPSKTDLAYHDPFTVAVRTFGKPSATDSATTIEIHKGGKIVNLNQVEKDYHDWIVNMHEKYDEEADCGEDEPVLVIAPSNKKKLGISSDVIRVHKIIRRKGVLWRKGQRIKIFKGAVGCTSNNLYATLECFLLEGLQGDAGGEARIICRLLGCAEEDGCMLVVKDGSSSLDIRNSRSFPISEIDNGKIQQIDEASWKFQLEKKMEKAPSQIDILTSEQCSLLNIEGELPLTPVEAGYEPPDEIVAVIRPGNYKAPTKGNSLDNRSIIRDEDLEMTMEVKLISGSNNNKDAKPVFSKRVKPLSRKGFWGLYIFQLHHERAKLFCKAGLYKFNFSVICKDISCKKDVSVTVNPGSSIEKWSFLDKTGNFIQRPITIRVGSLVSDLSVACLDKYMNRVPISKMPDFNLCINKKNSVLASAWNIKIERSFDEMSIDIKEMLFKCDSVDLIRPHYEATLAMYHATGGLPIAEVPCVVLPGPLCSVKMKSCLDTETNLSPGTVIKELELEMLDQFGNHVQEGVEASIQVDGLCFLDNMGSYRKVNGQGYINLSGLLKVTAGFGSRVGVCAYMEDKLIFEKALSVVKRELRIISEVPGFCQAGSSLKSVEFGVFDSDGAIDDTIHGHHHALTIASSTCVDNTIQYTFQKGRCIVPSIPIPDNQETFNLSVSHTQYPELSANIQVRVMHVPKLEVPISEPQTPGFQISCFDDGMPSSPYLLQPFSPQLTPCQNNLLLKTIMDDIEKQDAEVQKAGLNVRGHEEEISKLTDKMNQIASQVCSIQAQLGPQYLMDGDSFNYSKCQIIKQIESKKNTAASVLCNLSKSIQASEPRNDFMEDVLGLVVLLGTVEDPQYSSVFAEYLGEDYMLAVVCKSFQTARALENDDSKGEVDRDSALHKAAASLGSGINSRFIVICLELIRPYRGALMRTDPQKRLALPKPLLPNGNMPNGFIGYAVNLINLDEHHLNAKTRVGYGLRETLFYRLFGETQVYQTREQMLEAMSCIKHGAISLDGGIMKENGVVVLLGNHDPGVKFPVAIPQTQLEIVEQIEEKKAIIDELMVQIEKENQAHGKAVAKFRKREEKLKMYIEAKRSSVGSLFPNVNLSKTS